MNHMTKFKLTSIYLWLFEHHEATPTVNSSWPFLIILSRQSLSIKVDDALTSHTPAELNFEIHEIWLTFQLFIKSLTLQGSAWGSKENIFFVYYENFINEHASLILMIECCHHNTIWRILAMTMSGATCFRIIHFIVMVHEFNFYSNPTASIRLILG